MQQIIDATHNEGTLPKDVRFEDIGTMVARLTRPVPGRFAAELIDSLGHGQLDLLIEGLRPWPGQNGVNSGPALSVADLLTISNAEKVPHHHGLSPL
ncbi:MAG: hypothetical protein M3021_12220 [Actinomycetota bacterium]|nr:hypothetical protein [Actinomycetota bacterium]